MPEKSTKVNAMGPRDKPHERGRNQVIRCWSCGREGHIQRFCKQRTPENVIEQLSRGYASKFSGVSVANAIVRIKKSRKFPLLIMNNTNQTVTLKQGWSIARVNETSSITEITVPDKQTSHISDEELQQVNVSEEFKPEIDGLLKRNRDLFVCEDKHLGRTDTVKMRIDTGTHAPIKKVPISHTTQTKKNG